MLKRKKLKMKIAHPPLDFFIHISKCLRIGLIIFLPHIVLSRIKHIHMYPCLHLWLLKLAAPQTPPSPSATQYPHKLPYNFYKFPTSIGSDIIPVHHIKLKLLEAVQISHLRWQHRQPTTPR